VSSEQGAESREQRAEGGGHGAGSREQGAGSREQYSEIRGGGILSGDRRLGTSYLQFVVVIKYHAG